jgi:hypothetical protein
MPQNTNTDPRELINTIHNLEHLLATAIETRFDELQESVAPDHTGCKFQHRCHLLDEEMIHDYGNGIRFPFRTKKGNIVVLLLYGPANYVYSFEREFDRRGSEIREACFDAVSPHDDWVLTGYHDSCWREKVRNFINKYSDQLTLVGWMRFGEVVKISAEMNKFMSAKENERRR